MPESWTDDAARREKARVPDDLVFKTKPDLALDLITRAVDDNIPGEIVLVDAAYGGSSAFRNTVRMFGLDLGGGGAGRVTRADKARAFAIACGETVEAVAAVEIAVRAAPRFALSLACCPWPLSTTARHAISRNSPSGSSSQRMTS